MNNEDKYKLSSYNKNDFKTENFRVSISFNEKSFIPQSLPNIPRVSHKRPYLFGTLLKIKNNLP